MATKKFVVLFTVVIFNAAQAQRLNYNDETFSENQVVHLTKEAALKASGMKNYITMENKATIDSAPLYVEQAKNAFGNDYAGTWIEYDDNKRALHFVAVKKKIVSSKLQKTSSSDFNKILEVAYSYAELARVQKAISVIFDGVMDNNEPLVLSHGINEKTNRLVVSGRAENLSFIKSSIQEAGFNINMIDLNVQEGPVTLAAQNIYGGTKIISTTTGRYIAQLCTNGFNVVIDGIYPGSITAAHCKQRHPLFDEVIYNVLQEPGLTRLDGEYIGQFLANGWPLGIDAIIVANHNFVHTQGAKLLNGGGTVASVKPLVSAYFGVPVCSYGGTSGWRCGLQERVNVQHNVQDPATPGVITTLTLSEADLCGAGGDSGGPVVTENNNALGIYTGVAQAFSTGTCGAVVGGNGSRPKSVYQTLSPYFAQFPNVVLRTE